MAGKGHALARDELIRVLTAYSGVTTADGLPGGTTLIDDNLRDNPSISAQAIPEKTILIMSGDAIMEDKGATSFDNLTGEIALQDPGFSAQIKAGTIFKILNISSVEIDVAAMNAKLGTNVDLPGTTTVFSYLALLLGTGGGTFALVNAMLTLTETGGTVTTTGPGTEDDVYINDAPAGVFDPQKVKIDFTNQTAAETVVVRYYERFRAGGGWVLIDTVTFAGVQAEPGKYVDLEPNRFGVKVTMERTAGIAKDYDLEALYKA